MVGHAAGAGAAAPPSANDTRFSLFGDLQAPPPVLPRVRRPALSLRDLQRQQLLSSSSSSGASALGSSSGSSPATRRQRQRQGRRPRSIGSAASSPVAATGPHRGGGGGSQPRRRVGRTARLGSTGDQHNPPRRSSSLPVLGGGGGGRPLHRAVTPSVRPERFYSPHKQPRSSGGRRRRRGAASERRRRAGHSAGAGEAQAVPGGAPPEAGHADDAEHVASEHDAEREAHSGDELRPLTPDPLRPSTADRLRHVPGEGVTPATALPAEAQAAAEAEWWGGGTGAAVDTITPPPLRPPPLPLPPSSSSALDAAADSPLPTLSSRAGTPLASTPPPTGGLGGSSGLEGWWRPGGEGRPDSAEGTTGAGVASRVPRRTPSARRRRERGTSLGRSRSSHPAHSSGSTQAASSVEERRSVSTPSALLLGGRGGGGGGPAGHAAHFGREARAAFFALWREQGHISATDGDHAPRQIDSARRAYLSSALPQTATPERAAAASIIMGRVNE
jgi:hypothetical protein